jgi:zinc-ribbon domain
MKMRSDEASDERLVCPSCGAKYAGEERFCPACGLPLTFGPDARRESDVSERHRTARKIKPQLSEGRLVRVAGARNQAEGEFIQSMLLEEGVPSVLRRSAGFDVPDFLAAGPRDVLVPESGVATAREVLLQAELVSAEPPRPPVAPARLLVGLLVALVVGAALVWAIAALLH